MFVSDYFEVDISGTGMFDALLDKDSNFFINIVRLKCSTVPEFIDAYGRINTFFSEIATLLNAADSPSVKDKMFKEARKRFTFHELNGINLGFSKSHYGAGWGKAISDQVLKDAYQIVKKGCTQPEIFHLVNLFEDNVAGDRLSDMIATIIEPQIKQYTKRIMAELGITRETRPKLKWRNDDLVQNPQKNCPILLLPEEVLHELPIAKEWYEVDNVIAKNDTIRREISQEIGSEWRKWASSEQKDYLKRHIFMNPEACNRVIEGYKAEDLEAINLRDYPEYMAELLLKKIKQAMPFTIQKNNPTSLEAAKAIIGIFKDWVENNRGWAEIQETPKRGREKSVQRLMHLGAKYYIEKNNIDLSPDSNSGRGPVDIKLSRGNDKTLAEIKLSTNNQYLHGYKTQVEEYGKAERTKNLIYVFVDVGNPDRLKAITSEHEKNIRNSTPCPELIIIDATDKKAASTYVGDDIFPELKFDFDFPEVTWELDDEKDS